MKKILLILTLLISLSSFSYSDNRYPITRDSELMIARGKIAYKNNCAGSIMKSKIILKFYILLDIIV